MNTPVAQGAAWRDLLTREYFPKLATMSLALWLHASNSMLTATTMPSAVDEIGGLNLISWTFALYLAGSISAAASISLLVASMGLKQTMIRAALVFTGGCAVVALAPNMPGIARRQGAAGTRRRWADRAGVCCPGSLLSESPGAEDHRFPVQRMDDGVFQRPGYRRCVCDYWRMAHGLLGLRCAGFIADSGRAVFIARG